MRNQVVWITGASGGIGEAMINELGAKLVVSSRNSEALYTLRTIVKIVLLTFMYCSPTRKAEKALAKGKLIQEGEPGRECWLTSPVGDEIGWLSASNRNQQTNNSTRMIRNHLPLSIDLFHQECK